MLINYSDQIFNKNKIKRLRRRLKWRKPSFFFTNKKFGKVNQRKRWMAFRSIRFFRRHTILNNKCLFKYMIFFRQLKNAYKLNINKNSSFCFRKNINDSLGFLKHYLKTKNKQLISIKKKNRTTFLILTWFLNCKNKKNKNHIKIRKYRYTSFIKKYKQARREAYKLQSKFRFQIDKNRVKKLKKLLLKLVGQRIFVKRKRIYKLNRRYNQNYRYNTYKKWSRPNTYHKFIKKIKRIQYYKIPKERFAKWCQYLKNYLVNYYATTRYNRYLQKYYTVLASSKWFRYKFRFITDKQLYTFYKILQKIFKITKNKMVFSIQQEILQIIGYCKLKNFTISTSLSKIIYMLLNSIFHRPMIKHQLKKYNKFIVYFIKKINAKHISVNNKKGKLNNELHYLYKIITKIKWNFSIGNKKKHSNQKHLALRLLRLNRKHFKLNINQVKNSNFTPTLKLKQIKKNNKYKFQWFDRAKYLDRQKKRLKYKQKSRIFTPYQTLFLKTARCLYYKRFYNKKYNTTQAFRLNGFYNKKKFKNIQIAKALHPLLKKSVQLYKIHKNTYITKSFFPINSIVRTVYKKTLTQNINKYPFTTVVPNKTLYTCINNQYKINLRLTNFNSFIWKTNQKQNHYLKRLKIKTQKVKSYFIKKNTNFKKLLQMQAVPKHILYLNKKKLTWLNRSIRWNKKKLLRNRRFYLNWRKVKLHKRKLLSQFNNKPLKTFFIKNILNKQYQNLITNPKVKLKYLTQFKELFYERWLLGTFKKKAQIEPLFNFLIKKHSVFLQTFYLNPFIYFKQTRKNYYLKFKKYRFILKNYTKKITKLKKLLQNNKNIKKTEIKQKVTLLEDLHKKMKNKLYNTVRIHKLLKKHSFYFTKFNKLEQTLASSATDMTRAKRQAFIAIKSLKGLHKNFTNFFRYNIISTKQRNYFNKKLFINFLLNNYKNLQINTNKLMYLINTIKIDAQKSFLKKVSQTYFKTDLPNRIQTEYLKKRKRLNRYRSYQLYSKYRFNKRLFTNRQSRLRFGLTHFLRKWKRVQSIYSQKKFIVKFFLQQYYKGLNPTQFYKMKNTIKYKTNKLNFWYKQIENRADILLSKTKLTSNLWLSRYLITSKKIFFDNKLHTKTNTLFNKSPIITTNTQLNTDLFYNIYQNQEKTTTTYNIPLYFYQKTADTENFLNLTTNKKLKRYTTSQIASSNSNIFKIYKNVLHKKTLKFKRPLTLDKRKRRLFFFNKKRLIKKYKTAKKMTQSQSGDITQYKILKNSQRNMPKFLLYRTNRNNKGPFANLVQYNKYRTIYFNNWYTNYLTHLQTHFIHHNTAQKTGNINKFFNNCFISTKLIINHIPSCTQNQLKNVSNPITNIFNTTKTITTSILNTHFNSWRRTFEFKLHRRFKRRGRKRPRVLRTKFTKTRNNTLLTYDFLNFLRFNKI